MYEFTKNSQKGMRSMKKKISRMLVCFLMVFTLVAGTAVEASAAISFEGIYALSNGKVRFKISKATKGEAKVKYTFQNIYNGNKYSKTTTYTTLDYALARNMWYRTTVTGYNTSGKKVSSRTLYTCNAPVVNFSYYPYSRMRISWRSTYGSSGYLVYMSSDGGKTFRCVKNTKGTSYITPTLTKYKYYYFFVRPYKIYGGKTYYGAKPTYSAGNRIIAYYY